MVPQLATSEELVEINRLILETVTGKTVRQEIEYPKGAVWD
jgi:hypothetical protein